MELRAVGFDAGEETTGRVWMDDAEIDPKSGNADLRYNGCRLPLNWGLPQFVWFIVC